MSSVPECLKDSLTCPVCFEIAPDTRYFVCPNGHSICGNCLPRNGERCPQCRVQFSNPPTRNFKAERLIQQSPGLILACKNYPNGCEFEGPRQMRLWHEEDECGFFKVHCPQPECQALLVANQLEEHVNAHHNHIELSAMRPARIETYLSGREGQGVLGMLHVLKSEFYTFYLCRRIYKGHLCYYVVTNASAETANRYEVKIRFSGAVEHAMPVFSVAEEVQSILEHSALKQLALSELPAFASEDISKGMKRMGYKSVIRSEVRIVSC